MKTCFSENKHGFEVSEMAYLKTDGVKITERNEYLKTCLGKYIKFSRMKGGVINEGWAFH